VLLPKKELMGKWSNSRNGNLRYSVNRENNSGIYIGPTKGLSSPKNSRRGCLCLHSDTYDVACCKGYLMNQGIGQIESPFLTGGGGFSNGYDEGYEIQIG
jgi:hypothetical protein